MPSHSMLAGILLVVASPHWADARYEWFLGYGGAECTDTCKSFGRTCVPAQLPSDAVEMQSVVIDTHHACANIQIVKTDTMELFAPAYAPPTGDGHNGICYYPKHTIYSTCSTKPTDSTITAEKNMMRFCACSEVNGLQWFLGSRGQNCDTACAAHGGICDNVGSIWPMDQTAMSIVMASSGVQCSSSAYGESNAAPNLADSGVCRWGKSRSGDRQPDCASSEQDVRRFCPCYDVAHISQHLV